MGPVTMLPGEAGGKGSKWGREEKGLVLPLSPLSSLISSTTHS